MTQTVRPPTNINLITIPSHDAAFRAQVNGFAADQPANPAALERQLRSVFPRVVVRDRALNGEDPAWYVYRDGGWRPPTDQGWWEADGVPRVAATADGWLSEINATAAGMLGIDAARVRDHHFTDLSNSTRPEASQAAFAAVLDGHPLDATVLLRPTSGDVIAFEIHAERQRDEVVCFLRFADEPDLEVQPHQPRTPVTLVTSPATDAAFRVYALRAMDRMVEPTVDGLALRLHRVYPHATVRLEGDTWRADRDSSTPGQPAGTWWGEPGLARVRCDAQALILEANDAARQFFGRDLVGHHWQEFVVPGSSDAVAVMLGILREMGAAETRFRIPRPDGSLVEFDSYTTVDGDEFTSVIRPAEPERSR